MFEVEEKTRVDAIDRTLYDFKDKVDPEMIVDSGLTEEVIRQISKEKDDPAWMTEFRLESLKIYNSLGVPDWGPPIDGLNMDNIITYVRPKGGMSAKWEDVPSDIKNTFEKLGIPQSERLSLAGVGAQYDSEIVYHNVRKEVEEQGVVYTDIESSLKGDMSEIKIESAEDVIRMFDKSYSSIETLIHYVYSERDVFMLILKSSGGSSYENFINDLISEECKNTEIFLESCRKYMTRPENISERIIKVGSSIVIDTMFEAFLSGVSEEDNIRETKVASDFCIAGYKEMLGL